MASLFTKTKLYIEANSKTWDDTKVSLQNNSDGNGDFIASWSYDIAKPTEEQLDALESQAETLENNNQVINTRKKEYGTTAEQLEYIVENGVDAFVTKQNQIKSDNPKG
jgi:hypothetical protein